MGCGPSASGVAARDVGAPHSATALSPTTPAAMSSSGSRRRGDLDAPLSTPRSKGGTSSSSIPPATASTMVTHTEASTPPSSSEKPHHDDRHAMNGNEFDSKPPRAGSSQPPSHDAIEEQHAEVARPAPGPTPRGRKAHTTAVALVVTNSYDYGSAKTTAGDTIGALPATQPSLARPSSLHARLALLARRDTSAVGVSQDAKTNSLQRGRVAAMTTWSEGNAPAASSSTARSVHRAASLAVTRRHCLLRHDTGADLASNRYAADIDDLRSGSTRSLSTGGPPRFVTTAGSLWESSPRTTRAAASSASFERALTCEDGTARNLSYSGALDDLSLRSSTDDAGPNTAPSFLEQRHLAQEERRGGSVSAAEHHDSIHHHHLQSSSWSVIRPPQDSAGGGGSWSWGDPALTGATEGGDAAAVELERLVLEARRALFAVVELPHPSAGVPPPVDWQTTSAEVRQYTHLFRTFGSAQFAVSNRCRRCADCKACASHLVVCEASGRCHVRTCESQFCSLEAGPAAIGTRFFFRTQWHNGRAAEMATATTTAKATSITTDVHVACSTLGGNPSYVGESTSHVFRRPDLQRLRAIYAQQLRIRKLNSTLDLKTIADDDDGDKGSGFSEASAKDTSRLVDPPAATSRAQSAVERRSCSNALMVRPIAAWPLDRDVDSQTGRRDAQVEETCRRHVVPLLGVLFSARRRTGGSAPPPFASPQHGQQQLGGDGTDIDVSSTGFAMPLLKGIFFIRQFALWCGLDFRHQEEEAISPSANGDVGGAPLDDSQVGGAGNSAAASPLRRRGGAVGLGGGLFSDGFNSSTTTAPPRLPPPVDARDLFLTTTTSGHPSMSILTGATRIGCGGERGGTQQDDEGTTTFRRGRAMSFMLHRPIWRLTWRCRDQKPVWAIRATGMSALAGSESGSGRDVDEAAPPPPPRSSSGTATAIGVLPSSIMSPSSPVGRGPPRWAHTTDPFLTTSSAGGALSCHGGQWTASSPSTLPTVSSASGDESSRDARLRVPIGGSTSATDLSSLSPESSPPPPPLPVTTPSKVGDASQRRTEQQPLPIADAHLRRADEQAPGKMLLVTGLASTAATGPLSLNWAFQPCVTRQFWRLVDAFVAVHVTRRCIRRAHHHHHRLGGGGGTGPSLTLEHRRRNEEEYRPPMTSESHVDGLAASSLLEEVRRVKERLLLLGRMSASSLNGEASALGSMHLPSGDAFIAELLELLHGDLQPDSLVDSVSFWCPEVTTTTATATSGASQTRTRRRRPIGGESGQLGRSGGFSVIQSSDGSRDGDDFDSEDADDALRRDLDKQGAACLLLDDDTGDDGDGTSLSPSPPSSPSSAWLTQLRRKLRIYLTRGASWNVE